MEKFISLNEWINENESKERDHFGCVMLDAKVPDWAEKHLSGIDKKDLYEEDDDDSYGLNDTPHITLLYGLHEDEVEPDTIMDVIKQDVGPVTTDIKNISIFENEKYDVVKYDVPVTEDLKKYRDMFKKTFPNTQSFPDFHPHVTLAYVKPGEGSKYVKELDEPFSLTFNKGVYSFHERNKDTKALDIIRKEHVWPDPNKVVNLNNV